MTGSRVVEHGHAAVEGGAAPRGPAGRSHRGALVRAGGPQALASSNVQTRSRPASGGGLEDSLGGLLDTRRGEITGSDTIADDGPQLAEQVGHVVLGRAALLGRQDPVHREQGDKPSPKTVRRCQPGVADDGQEFVVGAISTNAVRRPRATRPSGGSTGRPPCG
jgi:hypothetical protein